jgi:methionyl-tRNA formyltransferase
VQLGRAYATVDGRRLLVERALHYDGNNVTPGSLALRDGDVVLGASDGAIVLKDVRPESGKSMTANAWWAGARLDEATVRWA